VVDSGRDYLLQLLVNLNLSEFDEKVGSTHRTPSSKREYYIKKALRHRYTTEGFCAALKFFGILLRRRGISPLDAGRLIVLSGMSLLFGGKRNFKPHPSNRSIHRLTFQQVKKHISIEFGLQESLISTKYLTCREQHSASNTPTLFWIETLSS
jgi:hypothetical protein